MCEKITSTHHAATTQVFKKEVIFLNKFQLRWQTENTDTLWDPFPPIQVTFTE